MMPQDVDTTSGLWSNNSSSASLHDYNSIPSNDFQRPTSLGLSDLSVGDILDIYKHDTELLKHILKAKSEEDKRKTAEELRRAEEARLQYKYLDLGLEQQRRISDPSTFTNEFLSGSLGSLVVTEGVPDWLSIQPNTMATNTTLSPMATSFHQFDQTPPSPTTSYYRPPSPLTTTSFETPFADLTISATSSPEPLDPNHIKKNNSSTSKLSSSNSNTSPIITSPTSSFPLKYENISTHSLPPPLPLHQEFPNYINNNTNDDNNNNNNEQLLFSSSSTSLLEGNKQKANGKAREEEQEEEVIGGKEEGTSSSTSSSFLSTTKSACKRTLSRTRSQRRPQVMAGKKKNRSIPLPPPQPSTSNDTILTTTSTLSNTSITNTTTNMNPSTTPTILRKEDEEPHLDHGKVMEALRAKLKRTSNPLSSSSSLSSNFFSSRKEEEETVIQPMSPQGMLLLDLKNPRKVFPNNGHNKRTSMNPRVAVLRRPRPFTSAHNHCEKTKETTTTTVPVSSTK